MADIKVVIQLQDTIEDEIKSLESPTYVNNASINKTGEQFNTLSTKSAGANLKSWAKQTYKNGEYVGSLSLADGYVGGANTQLIEQYGYNGYVFGAVPENKQLTVTLEVVGKYIDSIIVYGDRTANQFPTKAYRDGNPNDIIYSDDPVWAIKFDQQSDSHSITFLEWNRANYNACITYVAELKNELTLDKSWIKSVESLSQSTGQPKDIYYGVIPSSGTINLLDRDGEINDYLQEGILEISNTPINIYCNNDSQKLISHISNEGEYLRENKTLSLQLQDKFDLLLNNKYLGRKLSANTNAYNVISALLTDMGYSEYIDIMLAENMIVSTNGSNVVMSVKDYLSQITIQYPYLEESTYREALEKFCLLAQLNMMNKDGLDYPVFVSARPVIRSSANIIKVPQRNIFGDFKTDIIVKNKIGSVSCSYRNIVYDFSEITNNTIQIFDTSSSSSSSFTELNSKRVLSNSEYNSGFVVLKERVQDTSSYTSSSYNKYFYNIIKISTKDKLNIDLDYMRFKLAANVHIVNPNSDPVYSTTQQWISYTDENYPDVDIKDYTKSDQDILSGWLHPTYGTYSGGSNLDMRVRINQDGTADLFVLFLETIQLASSANTVVRFVDNYSLSFSVKRVSYNTVNTDENADIQFNANELLQDGTLFNGNKIVDIIKDNILNDYKNGLKTGIITVSCGNYYYENGSLAKDWSVGQILSVGDLVKVNGNNTIWRVTGRNFRKTGVPMIDLELQEVQVVV